MVSPRKAQRATKHCGVAQALRQKSADDALTRAEADDAHGGNRALLARGAGERAAAVAGRGAEMRTTPPAYLRRGLVLNGLDAFEAAALRLS